MQKVIKPLLERNLFILAVSITLLIAYLSLANIKLEQEVISFSNLDKIEHFTAYFVLAFSWFTANKKHKFLSKLKIFICLVIYGAFLEILQATLTSYRVGDILDLFANSLGILLAYIFFEKIHAKIIDIF
ncbi:VanZ family protein [Bacteroidota bacterium]